MMAYHYHRELYYFPARTSVSMPVAVVSSWPLV